MSWILTDSSRGLAQKIREKFAKYLRNICEIFAKNLRKIREKFAKNLRKIKIRSKFSNFSRIFGKFCVNFDFSQIFREFFANFSRIFRKFFANISQIFREIFANFLCQTTWRVRIIITVDIHAHKYSSAFQFKIYKILKWI